MEMATAGSRVCARGAMRVSEEATFLLRVSCQKFNGEHQYVARLGLRSPPRRLDQRSFP
jgi:hypothetical protein